jgi:hypothetical protein
MRESVDVAGSVERRLGAHLAAGQRKIVRLRKGGVREGEAERVRVCGTCYAPRCLCVSGDALAVEFAI